MDSALQAGDCTDRPVSGDGYRIRCLVRGRIGTLRFVPGTIMVIEGPTALRVVSHLIRCKSARPLDERTRIDVELHQLLDAVLPRRLGDGTKTSGRGAG